MAPRPQSTLVTEQSQSDSETVSAPDSTLTAATMDKRFNDDTVVISGIGGRYPESDSVDEFASNLFNKVDMITDDSRRWPNDLYDMNHRMGKLKEIDKFDGAFFGWRNQLGDWVDPHARIVLETTYEAICDSGTNPQSLRGSRTGVYVGYSSIGMPDGFPTTVDPTSRTSVTDGLSWVQGTSKAMYANRVSFFFDFRGPSMTIDTACSSSMVALDVAVGDILCGKVEQAVVAGVNINMQMFTNYFYQKLGFNSSDGVSRVWDADADGFVRGETVASLFLQRQRDSKRIYGRILNSRTNIDGYKKTGMFFPSSDGQKDLLIDTYKQVNIDPNAITYFEAHGTGTKVGDFQEASAIHQAYCLNGRTTPLPIGLLKSNIGHGEAASGVASLTKVAIAFENACIPANLNLKTVKSNIAELKFLKPITDNLPYTPGIAGVNSFGVGGVNGHVLLEPNYKEFNAESRNIASPQVPRLVLLHGRTKHCVEHLMGFIENNPNKVTRDFLALLADIFKYKPMLNSAGFPYRGTLMIRNADGSNQFSYQRSEIETTKFLGEICFFYSGIGGQAPAIAKELMGLDVFASKLAHLSSVVKPFGINLTDLLTAESLESTLENSLTAKFVSTTALQVILTDILKETLDIVPSCIVGHSFGEIAAAHAQEYISAEEAILISYHRGLVLEQARTQIPSGLMAAVGLSQEEAAEMCPPNVFVACDNAAKLVTISGEKKATSKFLKKLTDDGVFVRELDSSKYPLHTPYLEVVQKELGERIEAVFASTRGNKKQNLNSSAESRLKWISTCQSPDYMEQLHNCRNEPNFTGQLAKYFLDNLLKPVSFYNALNGVSDSAVMLEISGRELFEKVITGAKPTVKYLSLLRASARTPENMLTVLSSLYRHGLNPNVERFYPQVQWPVARGTQSVSSLLKWDYSDTYFVKLYPHYYFKPTESDLLIEIDGANLENDYLFHHIIDGRPILPGTSMLFFAWKRFADSRAQCWNKTPIRFEEVQFRRPVFLDKTQKIVLKVRLLDPSGEFVIMEGPNVICVGIVKELKKSDTLEHQEVLTQYEELSKDMHHVTKEDIYKDFHVRGYEYGPKFRCINDYCTDLKQHSFAHIQWMGHMIAFLDSLLQTACPVSPIREMIVPVVFPLVKIDPIKFFEAIEQNNISSSEVKDSSEVGALMSDGGVEESQVETEEMEELKSTIGKVTGEANQVKNADALIRTYVNADTKILIAPGIEIFNFTGAIIGRKIHSQPVSVESYQFVPHVETRALCEQSEAKLYEYEKVCASECRHLLGEFKLDKLCSIVMNGFADVADSATKEKYLKTNEKTTLLKILTRTGENCKDENNNSEITEEDACSDAARQEQFASLIYQSAVEELGVSEEKALKSESPLLQRNLLNHLHTDIMASMSHEERLIRPMVDTVAENFANIKEFTVLQLSPMQVTPLPPQVDKYLASSFLFKLGVDYTYAHPASDKADVDAPMHFNNVVWDVQQDPLWPSNLQLKQQPHLTILYDEPLLQELKLTSNEFWQGVQSSLLPTGFVMVLLRSSFTPLERIIYESVLKVKTPAEEELKQRIDAVTNAAAETNFLPVAFKSDNLGHCAMLFRQNQSSESAVVKTITFKQDQEVWLQEIKDQLKSASDEDEKKSVWLLADDQSQPGIMGFFNCLRKEPGGRMFRLLYLQGKTPKNATQMFEEHRHELTELDLAVNVFRENTWGTYRHLRSNLLQGTRMSTEYQVNLDPLKSDLMSLTLYDITKLRQINYLPEPGQAPQQKKYAVYSSALNFRDVMIASGRIFPNIHLITQNSYIGTEFAGRDVETGARVFGIVSGGAFGTSVYAKSQYVRPMPEHWSFDEAVGTLTTYFTVWYGLVYKARLRRGSSILIHCAAGGVGQAALYVCNAYGCKIYATAGTEEKRKFVHEKFGVPLEHIFSSRDCRFENEIRRLTKGKGVQYVLNSLIGEGLDASLRLVAVSGHFIELAKFEMQLNKRMGTFPFLMNLTYHGVAIEHPLWKEEDILSDFFDWLLSNCGPNQAVQPLSTEVFTLEDGINAFKHMTTGNHKGKIVIQTREDNSTKDNTISVCKPLKVQTKTYCDPRKVYIIVGGCGGVGLEVAHWLVRRGAKRIVLTSRSKERTLYQALFLETIKTSGDILNYYKSDISVYTEDISTEQGVRQMLSEVAKVFPIGGIFHLATALNDTLLENMTPEMWHKTIDSKATLAQHLDKASREMCPLLDYFVCFSSVSAGRGNLGQCNYGYANSVLDHICELRKSDGLHGLALQYGPIGDVGLLSGGQDRTGLASVHLQRIISCLDVLDRAMQSDHAVVSSVAFLDRSQQENSGNGDSLLSHLWSALGVDPDTLPDHVTLGELGMESMFAVEIQQTLEQEFGVRLSLNEIKLITVGELKSSDKAKMKGQLVQIKEYKKYLTSVKMALSAKQTEPLNSITEGEPIFMLPSVLGVFGAMQSFAEKINFPVIALNITPELNKGEAGIKFAAKHYTDLLRKLYPNLKRYNLVGLDYGAMVAMKMARQGLPSRVAVIDLKHSVRKSINVKDDKLHDHLIEFVLKIMLSGAFGDIATTETTKKSLLKIVQNEHTLEAKVRAISTEITRLVGDAQLKVEDMEDIVSGALRRAHAMFEYDNNMTQKKDKLTTRLMGKLARVQGRFLVIKDRNSSGLIANYLLGDLSQKLDSDSPIKLHHEAAMTLTQTATRLNEFFESKAF